MSKFKKVIGILGGMGPEASSHLYQDILKFAQNHYGATQDTDYPEMIIYNLPLEGFDETGIVENGSVQKQLVAGVQKLAAAGSDFVIVACNTVHYFWPQMQSAVKIPVLNLLDLMVKEVKKHNPTKVGVLSSESSRKLQLYPQALAKAELEFLTATDEEQENLNDIILHVMKGTVGSADKDSLAQVIFEFSQRGADAILIGCTELPLALHESSTSLTVVSCNQVLTEASLEWTKRG